MYLDIGMDSGDIIQKQEVDIGENESAGELWDRLAILGAEMLVKSVNDISNGIVKRVPQNGEVVIAPKIEKYMSKIDWNEKDALQIKNLIRGLTPGLGAFSILNGKKIKFWKVDVIEEKDFQKKYDININCDFGTVLFSNEKDGLFIKAKNGIISVIEIQGESSKKMVIYDFLRGNKINSGSKFE